MLVVVAPVIVYFTLLTVLVLAVILSALELYRYIRRTPDSEVLEIVERLGYIRGVELKGAGMSYELAVRKFEDADTIFRNEFLKGLRRAFDEKSALHPRKSLLPTLF